MKSMNDKNDFGFDFEDINSKSEPKKYEDIVSDTSYNYAVFGTTTPAGQSRGVYKKKKHGIAGVFENIRVWWKRQKKGTKAAVISLTSVILILTSLIVWFFSYFNYNYRGLGTDDLGFDGVIDKKIINVALFGIDTRDEKSFKGHSDSIMILSLNTETKKVKIISLMRDTLVPIERDGKTQYKKLTDAYYLGGPELAIKTINQCFGLDISEYATVNFYGMADIIEAVGGITATLTPDEVNSRGAINGKFGVNDMIEEVCAYMGYKPKDYYITKAGEQHLNGVQAVAYSRIRYVANVWGTNNDYGRTDRQRYVMEQLFNRAVTMSKTQYVKLAKALIPCSETSLSYGDIMNLAVNVLLGSPSFEQARVPQNEFLMPSPSGSFGSVVYFDLDYAAKVIHAFIYDDITVEDYVKENGIEKNNWYGTSWSVNDKKNETTTNSKPQPTVSSEPDTSSDTDTSSKTESNTSDTSSDESSDVSSSEDESSTPSTDEPTDEPTDDPADEPTDEPSPEPTPDPEPTPEPTPDEGEE